MVHVTFMNIERKGNETENIRKFLKNSQEDTERNRNIQRKFE